MARLVACKHCRAQISAEAQTCPNCYQHTSKMPMAPCHVCGERLIAGSHRWKDSTSFISNGNTQYRYHVVHIPCTKCGEPRPHASLWERFGPVIVIIGLVLLVLFVKINKIEG